VEQPRRGQRDRILRHLRPVQEPVQSQAARAVPGEGEQG